MKNQKPRKMLKRKKDEGLVSYFERWVEHGHDAGPSNKAPKWGPIGVSWNLCRKINETLR